MSDSQDVKQLARAFFTRALQKHFSCEVTERGVIPEIITDREGVSVRLSWVTQDDAQFVTHAEGQFYPTPEGGRLDIFPRLRVPNRPDLERNDQGWGFIVTLLPDGTIQIVPADEVAAA